MVRYLVFLNYLYVKNILQMKPYIRITKKIKIMIVSHNQNKKKNKKKTR